MIPSIEQLKLVDQTKLSLTRGEMIKEVGILPTYVLDDLYRVYDIIKDLPNDEVYDNDGGASTVGLDSKIASLVVRWLNIKDKISFDTYNYLSKFSDISRMIISKTTPHTIIDWHVMHENPRMHIQLFGRDCYFDVLDSDKKLHSKKLETGKLYAVNVCYPHRVRCMGNVERIQLFYDYTQPLF
jgi:hypothetical protein